MRFIVFHKSNAFIEEKQIGDTFFHLNSANKYRDEGSDSNKSASKAIEA